MDKATVKLLLQDFIKLSSLTECPNCSRSTKLIGETRKNGGWFCPWCGVYFPYKDSSFNVEVPFTKLTTQLEIPEPLSLGPLGDPPVDFPLDMDTGFLVPSYNYKIKRKRNLLLAVMEDFSRVGRVKSGTIWQFDLVWSSRSKDEYDALTAFADVQGYNLPFSYTDPFLENTYTCFFDSDVGDADIHSFDDCSFSVRITE